MSLFNKRIGIIGGGQLGKMMIQEAKKMGFYVSILDPDAHCTASSLVDEHIVASFDDKEAILKLADISDVITYEFEHINVEALFEAEKLKPVYPAVKSLEIIQDKYKQNQALFNAGVHIPKFAKVESIEDIKKQGEILGFPLMLKAAKGGYDGKGNFFIKNADKVEEGFVALGSGKISLFVEEFVDFNIEISTLACRGIDGDIVIYPIAENTHKNEVLNETKVPAAISDDMAEKAMGVAKKVMQLFEGVGMFCVEMFACKDGSVLVNEIAPRPHNSGHFSIEACYTSQFENHIRAIVGLPLGSTKLISPVSMFNILGEQSGKAEWQNCDKALQIEGVNLHIYGKNEVRPKRKMGHITALADSVENASAKAKQAYEYIQIMGVN